jgi:hypothetical protein
MGYTSTFYGVRAYTPIQSPPINPNKDSILDTRGAMWESNRQPADKRRISACLTRGLDSLVRGTCDENQNAMPHLPGYVHDMYGVGIGGYQYGPGLTPPFDGVLTPY